MALTKSPSAHTTFTLFNDLLPELRLKVYELALATPRALSIPAEDCLDWDGISEGGLSIFQGVALLRCSRKIYNEALPIFYAVNHFHFDLFADWEGSSRSIDLSNHIAMIRHIGVAALFPKFWLDHLCASRLREFLHKFPQLHSFAFFSLRNYPRPPLPPLNEMAETLGELRQRCRSMTIIFDFHDEENLQRLRDVIAPHDEWQHQKDSYWHIYSIGPREQAGVLNAGWTGCTVEKL